MGVQEGAVLAAPEDVDAVGPQAQALGSEVMRTGSCSQSCQPAGTYQRCQSWSSCPRANTSMRSAPQEQAVGFPVSRPPCACHSCQAAPSQ